MAGELPVDLRTWRKGDGQGRGVAFDGIACPTDSSGQSPSRTRPVGIGTSLVSGCEASGEREGAQSSPVPPDSGALLPGRSASAIFSQAGLEEKKAETYLPLRKRRYAMQGADGDTQGPLVGKVPKTEHSDGDMDSWNSQCNGCCPSYISVTYPRLPAGYYPGLAGSFLNPELSPLLHPVTAPPLVGVPNPYSLLEAQLALDIAMATKQDEDGDTPLHIAVVQGNLPVARRLVTLFHQGHRELDTFNNLRQTPLHLAAITAQPALVKLLLAHGASPMVLDRNGQTALHLACEHGSLQCLQELLEGSPAPLDLEVRNFDGFTPLHIAVSMSNHDIVLLLLDHGADIDAVDIKSGRSPLLHAVENNNLDMMELLLKHAANVNAQSYGRNTALHAASGRGLLDALRLLVRNGADSSLKNYHNDTPLMVAKNKKVIDILRGKASRLGPPPDNVRESSSPATSTASSPGNRPASNTLLRASPDSCLTPPSPALTPKPQKAGHSPGSTNQRPESITSTNGTSAPGCFLGVKLERNPTPPLPEQPIGYMGTPKFFLPLPENVMDPAFHGALYPFPASSHTPPTHHHLQLLPIGLSHSIISLPTGSLANPMHPRGTGMDQSQILRDSGNLPTADHERQTLHSRDSGSGGS